MSYVGNNVDYIYSANNVYVKINEIYMNNNGCSYMVMRKYFFFKQLKKTM